MASTKDEITAIAVEHGYTGKKPDSIAKAIDALADTLAGEDVTGSRSISGAVKALAPYIGGGGGGTTLGALVNIVTNLSESTFFVSTSAYDITNTQYIQETEDALADATNVCIAYGEEFFAPAGCYVAISYRVPSDWSTDSLQVYIDDEPVTSGFECRVISQSNTYIAYVTMQIPDNTLYIDFGIE